MATEGAKTFDELVRDDPDSLPTNPDDLANMIAATVTDDGGLPADDDKTDDDATNKAEEDAKAKSEADAKAKTDADAKVAADAKAEADRLVKEADDAKAAKDDTTKVDGVLTKDGQRVLPYGVLASERRRADEAERARKEADEARAKAERALAEARTTAKLPEKTEEETEDEIAQIEKKIEALKDVPEVTEVVAGLKNVLTGLKDRLDAFDEDQKQRNEREQAIARERVQDAIEQIPQLHYWQAEKPELWAEAVGYDKAMRDNPKLTHLSMEQRFERVVKVMEGVHGATELPETYKAKATPASQPATQKTAAVKEDEKKDTKVKVDEKVITLSDLPGGVPPKDESKAVEEMTTQDISDRVNRMLDQGKSVQDIISLYG